MLKDTSGIQELNTETKLILPKEKITHSFFIKTFLNCHDELIESIHNGYILIHLGQRSSGLCTFRASSYTICLFWDRGWCTPVEREYRIGVGAPQLKGNIG